LTLARGASNDDRPCDAQRKLKRPTQTAPCIIASCPSSSCPHMCTGHAVLRPLGLNCCREVESVSCLMYPKQEAEQQEKQVVWSACYPAGCQCLVDRARMHAPQAVSIAATQTGCLGCMRLSLGSPGTSCPGMAGDAPGRLAGSWLFEA